MPPKPSDQDYPKKIQAIKEDGKFVLKDENGFYYDRKVEFKDKKTAEAAADEWTDYYQRPLVL